MTSMLRRPHPAHRRLARLDVVLEDWSAEAGLHQVPDHFPAHLDAEVTAASFELFGRDRLIPARRHATSGLRAMARADARSVVPQLARMADTAAALAARASLVRSAISVAAAGGAWGLSQPSLTPTDWIVVALAGVLVLVNLPLIVPALRLLASFVVWGAALAAMLAARLASRGRAGVVATRCRAEERRHGDREQWRQTELASRLAAYRHKRELANRAVPTA
jgi:hypothetical protein